MAVWINEFHYDNTGTDAGEFIEVAGTAGTDLTGWSLVLYNGNPTQLTSYSTTALNGVIANQSNGFGTISVSYPSNGIQNGDATATQPDGIALVDNLGAVVQFLSYEGSFTASGGAANGLASTDIGIAEAGTEAAGGSLHLVGSGDDYADFTWTATSDDSPGAVNAGQNFLGAPAAESVAINDVSIAEGDAGTALLTFTVARGGNLGAFTIDFATADGTATAASDYVASSGTLTFAADGALSQTISVIINGDTIVEANEAFTLDLSNLTDTTGTTTLSDASGTGTITNDELVFTEIAAIQGAGHRSGLITVNTGSGSGVAQAGNSGADRYNVEGVVTAIATNGFYMQDATPDALDATSDGIFVFTGGAPAGTLTVGETVRVLGAQVGEFRAATNNLTVTQLNSTISGASVQELGGNTAIAPVVIGAGGRLPPTGQIEDDSFASFDPLTDAIDFYESLEGMLVRLPAPVAVSITAEFRTRDPANSSNAAGPPNEEIWVVIPGTSDPGGNASRGAPLLGETETNPERIQIDDLLPSVDLPSVSVGAKLSSVTGVVNYDFQNYEVLVATAPTVVRESRLKAETTALGGDARRLTVASYNVENLDPKVESTAAGSVQGSDLYARLGNSDDDVGSGKFAAHAAQIAINLKAPTIVALQEVQDNDGAEISGDVDAATTLQTLVNLIFVNHGIQYAFAYANPTTSNTDGGQPNANIRPAFLYRADQVRLLDATPEVADTLVRRITDPNIGEADGFAGDDFASSRKPLEARFGFNGQEVTIINNHFNSKGGDNALFGNVQPPVLGSEAQRIEQARIVNDRVDALLAADPTANIMVVGDLNDFAWSRPNTTLDGTINGGTRVLTDLAEALLPLDERYSYNFQGNAQTLDHMLVSDRLLNAANPAFDIVHVNSDLATGVSDHDPSVARFDFRAAAELLVLGSDDDRIYGLGGADTIDGGSGNDQLFGGMQGDVLLGGTQNDTLNGQDGADSLLGGEGIDLLRGGAGADTLDGGAGRDRLLGEAGEDVFLFNGATGDIVLGFDASEDLIAVSASAFDPTLGLGALDASRFLTNISGQSTLAGTGVFVFETDTSRLWFDTDGAGAGRSLVSSFGGLGAALTAADIFVIA